MQNPETTDSQQSPDPRLLSQIKQLNAAIRPVAHQLSLYTPFISSALFIKDRQAKYSANTVTVVNTPTPDPEALEFTESSIRGHQIDLTSTTLGKTFACRESKIEISKLNPKNHLTWGIYGSPSRDNAAVLQFVFDRNFSQSLDEPVIAAIVQPHLKNIWKISKSIIQETTKAASLADQLMLDVPVTPNAYIINWDIIESTTIAVPKYPYFKQYLVHFESVIASLAVKYGAQVVAYKGDGQNITVMIPDQIDKSDLHHVGEFGRKIVLPFAHELLIAHTKIAMHYPTIHPLIRIGVGLGYIEQLTTGEVTGPVFWEVATQLRHQKTAVSELRLNRRAQFVLQL